MSIAKLDPPTEIAGVRLDGSRECAAALDARDPLAHLRDEFVLPKHAGRQVTYLTGNSLGLQPRAARAALLEELDAWGERAVDAHFEGAHPWFPYHEFLRSSAAHIVGAREHEVVVMNSLTTNLHLLLTTFYRPTRSRFRILIEDAAFPSDIYVARTQLRLHGVDPQEGLIVVRPPTGESVIRNEEIENAIRAAGESLAVVLLGGVNYFTGQLFDLPRLARAAHEVGAIFGVDAAHAAGNVPLRLHDDGIDFAAWCSYKYLNSGPGAVAGAFVHERHARDTSLPRMGGWWGNDPKLRFRMHLESEFVPTPTADGWQLSNPPILALAPTRVAYEMFERVGMPALRAKSEQLTAYARFLLALAPSAGYEVITPGAMAERGCQWSLRFPGRGREVQAALQAAGVVCDYREPDVVRAAPTPMYNRFVDVWAFVEAARSVISK